MDPTDINAPVRRASARLANIVRHRPGDADAIRCARLALVRAQAAALRAEADRLEVESGAYASGERQGGHR